MDKDNNNNNKAAALVRDNVGYWDSEAQQLLVVVLVVVARVLYLGQQQLYHVGDIISLLHFKTSEQIDGVIIIVSVIVIVVEGGEGISSFSVRLCRIPETSLLEQRPRHPLTAGMAIRKAHQIMMSIWIKYLCS